MKKKRKPSVSWTLEESVVRTHTGESVIGDCDRRHHDRCECVEDGKWVSRSSFHLGRHRNRELHTAAKREPRDYETSARSVCSRRAWTRASMAKTQRIESSEKVKNDDQRKCYYCREAGHAKSQSRTRLKDLGRCRGKPVTANTRPSSISADAPADDHVTMFLETTMRSDAGSTAPTESGRVRLTSAIPTCETCLMMDTCGSGGICPRGSD